jgi:hypothetical protein
VPRYDVNKHATRETRQRGAYAAAEAKRRKKRKADAYAKELRAERKVYKREHWYPHWNAATRAAEREAEGPPVSAPSQPPVDPEPMTEEEWRAAALADDRRRPELRCAHGVYAGDCLHCTPKDQPERPLRGRFQY